MDRPPRDTPRGNRWLEALAADPTPAALERVRTELLMEGPDDRHRAVVEMDAVRAGLVHDRMADRLQVGKELSVLNDLARRLSNLHDTAEVLQEVTAQARRLLDVDVSFIMLRTEDAYLRIEYTEGSLGSALLGAVLNEGEGVGGEVMRTGQPVWTYDYLADRRLTRVASVDIAAASEHLGGILGVPLRAGPANLGVLLAADRAPHSFLPREIQLLAGLASHAALAIRNAALFEESQRSVAQLLESNALLTEVNAQRQAAADLHETLSKLVISGGTHDDLAMIVGRALDADVASFDRTGVPTTTSTTPWPDEAIPDENWFIHSGTVSRVTTGGAPRHVTATAIVLSDGFAGSLVAISDAPIADSKVQLLQTGATSVALISASQRAVAEAQFRNRGELLSALLDGEVDDPSLRRRARAAGVNLSDVATVVVSIPGTYDDRTVTQWTRQIVDALGGWWATYAGHSIALLRESDTGIVRQRIVSLDGSPSATVGIAGCDSGAASIRSAYESARQTAELLLAMDRKHSIALAGEVGIYRGLFHHAGRGDITSYVDSQLGPLIHHDEINRRDLLGTLECYLDHSQNHRRTAEALFVHNNTLYNHLDRITELLGDDWRSPERAFGLQLALRLRRLRDSLAASDS